MRPLPQEREPPYAERAVGSCLLSDRAFGGATQEGTRWESGTVPQR